MTVSAPAAAAALTRIIDTAFPEFALVRRYQYRFPAAATVTDMNDADHGVRSVYVRRIIYKLLHHLPFPFLTAFL